MKQISNNDKAKLVTAYTIFFNIPIDINDSMTLWCKSLEVEKGKECLKNASLKI